MSSLGSHVTKVDPPYNLRRAKDIVLSKIAPGFTPFLAKEMKKYGLEKDPDMARAIEVLDKWVATVPAKEIVLLNNELPALRQAVMASMEHCDVMLTPVTLTPAMRHGETWDHVVDDFIYPEIMGMVWSLPSGTVRCGSSSEGLPIGVQVVGSPNREDIVLAVMSALERELGGWQKPSL